MSSLRTERGQTVAEYAGVLLRAAVPLAALFAVVPQNGGTVAHADERLVPGDDCAAAGQTSSHGDATDAAGRSQPAAAPER